MNNPELELFEYCKKLILLAELAQADPDQAVRLAVELPCHPAAKALREAVACHAAGYRQTKRDFERVGISWETRGEAH